MYSIDKIEKHLFPSYSRDSLINAGIGTYLNHARNYFDARILSVSHQGNLTSGRNKAEWGLRFDNQAFNGLYREWLITDSSGYNLPYSGNEIIPVELADSDHYLNINRLSAYIQNTLPVLEGSSRVYFNGGVRTTYCSFSNRLIVSPRSSATFHPGFDRNLVFHLSGGFYYQYPFYRELQDRTGNINFNKQPQRSIHLVTGADYFLKIWDRPFKLSYDLYYKWLTGIIPYSIDNMRIRYNGANNAKGYAAGMDMKLHGDFVRGIDSWISLSLLRTMESAGIINEQSGERSYTSYYPRPTDQLFNLALFFQDYLPDNPSYKVHMKIIYSSRLPFSPPAYPPMRFISGCLHTEGLMRVFQKR
jgi:hypothetical protein